MNTYLYVLRLIDRLRTEEKWTSSDNHAVNEHFIHLKDLLAKDVLILAGKTDGLDERTFGIVIFKCNTNEEAKALMKSDPAVIQGIMTAELFPYTIALSNINYK